MQEGDEHLTADDQPRMIAEFARVLAPGGIVVISSPNKRLFTSRSAPKVRRLVRRPTSESSREQMERANGAVHVAVHQSLLLTPAPLKVAISL